MSRLSNAAGQLATAVDPRKSQPERAIALAHTSMAIPRDATLFRGVRDVLLDRDQVEDVRLTALSALNAAFIGGRGSEPFRAEFLDALKETATDGPDMLRLRSFSILSGNNVAFATQTLLDGLRGQGPKYLPDAVALQMLARDPHSGAVAVAAEILRNRTVRVARSTAKPADKDLLAVAVRALAPDASAARDIDRILRDKSEDAELRLEAADTLRAMDAVAFDRAARHILADDTDSIGVRTGCLTRLTFAAGAVDQPLRDVVGRLLNHPADDLRKAAETFAARHP